MASTKQQSATLSAVESARLLGTRLDYLYHLLQAGVIAAAKVDGEWRIERRGLETYRSSHPKLGSKQRQGAEVEVGA